MPYGQGTIVRRSQFEERSGDGARSRQSSDRRQHQRESSSRGEVESVLVDGFFPTCPPDAEPQRQRTVGLQELGLPYASDPAVSKHLAGFLRRNADVLAQKTPSKREQEEDPQPTAILFNGGVFKAAPLQERLVEVLNGWTKAAGGSRVKVLQGNDLDLSVARGALTTAWSGAARVCVSAAAPPGPIMGVETSLPAVPEVCRRSKRSAWPFGMEGDGSRRAQSGIRPGRRRPPNSDSSVPRCARRRGWHAG